MARRYKAGNFQAMSLEGVEKAVKALREKGENVLTAAKSAIKKGAETVTADAKNQRGVPYGRFVEFGARGRPFFYPAMDAHREEINENVKNAIQESVRQGKLWKPAR